MTVKTTKMEAHREVQYASLEDLPADGERVGGADEPRRSHSRRVSTTPMSE
jgi:hypothetical protein